MEARLWRPPPEAVRKAKPIPDASPWSAKSEAAAFAAFKGELAQ